MISSVTQCTGSVSRKHFLFPQHNNKTFILNPTTRKQQVVGLLPLSSLEAMFLVEPVSPGEVGVELEHNGGQESEINKRIGKAINLYYAINNKFIKKKEITKKTKLNVFKTVFRPILTFGCESWVLNKAQESKIGAIEMKFLRDIKRVTRMDRIRNTVIREELEIETTIEYIKKRQLSWWGHLQRLNNKRQVKKV
ncbi:unnamed protein product [Brassicogethes aeneus]|uniref:Endonuclease-reverse transcriptase n=1 Tax=Brassicogethes aeneus TaxID=1431903 RepID=A0A9P0B594_BRAAE|nr:unnamed protein product [Brassicogethes aeneus]